MWKTLDFTLEGHEEPQKDPEFENETMKFTLSIDLECFEKGSCTLSQA